MAMKTAAVRFNFGERAVVGVDGLLTVIERKATGLTVPAFRKKYSMGKTLQVDAALLPHR